MMLAVNLDVSSFAPFGEMLRSAPDQVPFALANSLNDAAFKARQVWVSTTWPSHIEQRNSAFLNAALRVEKASKTSLTVALTDRLQRDYLQRLAKGGIARPKKARRFGVPLKGWVQYGARGRPTAQKLQTIIARTPKRALRITSRGLFVGESGSLHLRYSFKDSITQPKRVPFYEDFEFIVRNELRTGFGDRMAQAIRTRR
jgi:hypothetical protein